MSLKPSKKQIYVLLSTKNDGKEKLDLYGAEPNPVVYSSLLRWCGRTKSLSNGMRLHAQIIKSGVEGLLFLGNLLLQMVVVGLWKMHENCLTECMNGIGSLGTS